MNDHPAWFLLVLAVIVVVCQAVHVLCRRLGQPVVIGEMVAGVMLGPSLLGLVAPGVQKALLPDEVLSVMGVVSQLGLTLFMFTVGLEFSVAHARGGKAVGAGVSVAGVGVPLALGVGFAYLMHERISLFPDGVPTAVGAVYLGLLLAITAFTVMARIITDRGLARTRYGTLSLTAGAVDDVCAWVLMALVLAMAGTASSSGVWLALGGLAVLAAVLILAHRLLERILATRWSKASDGLVVALVALLAASWYTDAIGVHAVVGAFALGVVMPRGEVSRKLIRMVRPVTVVLFLPLFFVYSGLRTDFRVLGSGMVLLASVALVAVAFVGKFGACSLTAWMMGESWADAARIGVLMNTRGLMQLIALNVGLQAGLVTPTLFALIVIVALVTTLCAAPGLSAVDRLVVRRARRATRTDSEMAPRSI